MKIGYAHVNTTSQNLNMQVSALTDAENLEPIKKQKGVVIIKMINYEYR